MRRLLVLVLVAPACVGNIQRSARVPHASVPLSSGQPLDETVELSGGLANAHDLIKPKVGNPSDAVETPEVEARGELRFRLSPRVEVAAIYEHGFGNTSEVPDKTQAPVGDGDVHGYGALMRLNFPTSTPGFVIGTTLELMDWQVPYVEYETCTDCVTPTNTIIDHGTTTIATIGAGIAPSYRTGSITVFGGAFVRNHPYTVRKSIDTTLGIDDGDVHNGPLNVLLHAGVEIALSKAVSALVMIHQDVVADPLRYGPGIGVAINARLGD
jgi:hypothetical protein